MFIIEKGTAHIYSDSDRTSLLTNFDFIMDLSVNTLSELFFTLERKFGVSRFNFILQKGGDLGRIDIYRIEDDRGVLADTNSDEELYYAAYTFYVKELHVVDLSEFGL